MSDIAPEFSRRVPLMRLGPEPFRQRIEATLEEREKLSRRFDLLALDHLVAEVELCAVTLEPARGAISHNFSLIFGPAPDEEQEIAFSGDEPAFEPLTGDAIDIGEAVAQELSLTLPEFPRLADATIDDFAAAEPAEGPFAALASLRKNTEC
jgi:hypothetical protein